MVVIEEYSGIFSTRLIPVLLEDLEGSTCGAKFEIISQTSIPVLSEDLEGF